MILSRQKPATCIKVNHGIKKAPKMPVLDDFLDKRDYVGAITLLEFQRRCGKVVPHLNMWIAYCWFHLADYKKAYAIYKKMIEKTDCDPQALINLACCCMYLGLYDEAYTVLNTPQQDNFSILQSRLLFHLSHKLNKERNMMVHMSRLENIDDKCSYYSLHFMRGNYEEAINSFKHLLNLDKNFAALKVYLAMCYFKLEYYDVAQDYLSEYLQQHPGSVLCSNLRACIFFRLYNGKAAEAELRSIKTPTLCCSDVIQHNKVVFGDGRNARQVLPPLVGVIHEARWNLALFLVKQGEYKEAYGLLHQHDPKHGQEYLIKAVTMASLGQEEGDKNLINSAAHCYKYIVNLGDTVLGRQCMMSSCFLRKEFRQALNYFDSIKGYLYNDDDFNFNYGQAKLACGKYKEAEEIFGMIQNEILKTDFVFLSCFAHCYIMNKKPQLAWKLYMKLDTCSDSFNLLQFIANDCYKMRHFYIAAKAFDVLEHLDPSPAHWSGKRGALVGLFQSIVLGREPRDMLKELLLILRNTSNPQVEYISRIIIKWANDHRVEIN